MSTGSQPHTNPWWLPGSHAQTVYPLLRKPQTPEYLRERVDTPDGDFIDFDWLAGGAPEAPLIVLFHGLEGSSRSHYARSLMQALTCRSWRGVIPHFRGCSGEPNRLARAYHSGDSAEIDWMLRHILQRAAGAPVYAVGVSLGGNALLKWMGEQKDAASDLIASAVAICPPLDLSVSGHALGHGLNRLYTRHFLSSLKPKALSKLERFPGLFDAERMRHANTLFEFDDVYTGPVHGFAGAQDYWARASSRPWLGTIALPTLLLTAANDSFVPPAAVPLAAELSSQLIHERHQSGGHVGFVSGPWPGRLDWLPERVLKFLTDGC